ncbi:MAG: hypothetical protein HYT97_07605 [Elusimicrobia bacterium]|nr:hypothetical protein [Elusimicrobiota bacterium]
MALVEPKALNPKLRELSLSIRQYHKEEIKLGTYIKLLTSTQPVSSKTFPNIKLFLSALSIEESLNFEKVEEERRDLTKALMERLPQSELENLIATSVSYRLKTIAHSSYYQYLKELCRAYDIQLNQYPDMDQYIQYVLISEKINTDTLFSELNKLEARIIESNIKNLDERNVIEISKGLNLIEKLINYELSPLEWEEYKSRNKDIKEIESRISALKSMGQDKLKTGELNSQRFGEFRKILEPFEQFNQAAVSRNSSLVNNLLKKVQEGNIAQNSASGQIALMVTGGFHTTGITQILKEKKIAYVVIEPRLEEIKGIGTEYLNIFNRDKTPLEKLFTGERITLKSPLPTAMTPPNGEISPVTYVVERKFSLFAAALLTRKILAQVTNLSRAQRKEIEKTISTWFKKKGRQFQTLEFITIDQIEEFRNKEGVLEKVVINVILHGKEGQKDSVVAVEVLSKDSKEKRGVEDADLLNSQEAVTKVGEDLLTLYVPHPSVLIELKDILNHKLPKFSNWILERIRNRSFSLVRNVKDKVSGVTKGSNEIIDSMKDGELRHLAALKTTTAEQFGNRWFIRLDGDMLGTLNLLYGKPILGTPESEYSLFLEFQKILKKVVIEEGGNLYMGEGADEIILEFEGDFETINKKLNNVIAKYTIGFRDRYAVLRIESRKLTAEQESRIRALDGVLVVAEHGNGFNVLVNREGLQNTNDLMQEIQKIVSGQEVIDITHTKINKEVGFLTLSGGAVSFETVIEYMVEKIFEDDDKKGKESTLKSIREELEREFKKENKERDETFLKLFHLIGLQLSDIAVGKAKDSGTTGRNQGFVPEDLDDLKGLKEKNIESTTVDEENQKLVPENLGELLEPNEEPDELEESESTKKEGKETDKFEGPEVTRYMIENPSAALEGMKAKGKEEGKDSLTDLYTVGRFKELVIEGNQKFFGFFKVLSYFKTLGRERAFHKWQEKVQHKGGDKTIKKIGKALKGNKADIFGNGERVLIARQKAEDFVTAYDTRVRGPPALKKVLEELTSELKKIYPDVELELIFYEVSFEEMEALKAREDFKAYQNQYKLMAMMEQIVESMATVGVDELRKTGLIVEQDGPLFIVRFNHTNFDQLMQSYRDAQDRLAKRAQMEMAEARKKMPIPTILRDEESVKEEPSYTQSKWEKVKNILTGEEGTSTVEYGLILAAINPIGFFIGGVSLVVWGIVNLVKELTKMRPSLPESVLLNNLLEQLPENSREPLQKDLSKGILPKPEKLLNQIKSQSILEQEQLEQLLHTIHLIQMARIVSGIKGIPKKGDKLEPQQSSRISRFLNSKELAQVELNELINAYDGLYKSYRDSKEDSKEREMIKENFGYLATVLFESGGANDLGISFESRWKAYQGISKMFNSESTFSETMKESAKEMWENGRRRKEEGSYSSRLIRTEELDSMVTLETGTSGIELFNVDDLSSNGIKLLADRIRNLPSGKQIYLYSSKGQPLTSSLRDHLIKEILDLNVDGVDSNRLKQIKFGEKQIYGTTDLTEIVTRIRALSNIPNPLVDIFTERNVFKGSVQGLRIQIFVILSETHLIEISKDLELIQKSRELFALQQ